MTDFYYKTILLDQDGPLAGFATRVREIVNKAYRDHPFVPQISTKEMTDNPTWESSELWGISVDEWWTVIRDDEDFWLKLPVQPWAKQLVDYLSEHCDELIISTAPSSHQDTRSCAQKLKWLETHFGIQPSNVMLGPKKYLMAKPDVCLIDDHKYNTDIFHEHGGTGILIPADWNTANLTFEQIRNVIDHYHACRTTHL